MDSSSSSSSMSPIISQEEFLAFHNIDRQLFCRLVFSMNREPAEAMQVAALWLWLERLSLTHYVSTLLQLPESVLEAVYQETLLCLKVVESDNDDILYVSDIPVVQNILGRNGVRISLKFFHENRINVLLGVGNIIQQVCFRAFRDLIQVLLNYREQLKRYQEYYPPLPPAPSVGVIGGSRGVGARFDGSRAASQPPAISPVYEQNYRNQRGGLVETPSQIRVGDFSVPLRGQFTLTGNDYEHGSSSSHPNNVYLPQANANANASTNYTTYGLGTQPQAIQRDLIDILAQMRASGSYMPHMGEDRFSTLPGERTIFLTFSKGYPILEFELREFLNRTFGDVIETLYMQEVGENEQPLYARLVVRDIRAMELILSSHGRSKFSINGKHVWARKYVRKNPSSPPSSPIDMTK